MAEKQRTAAARPRRSTLGRDPLDDYFAGGKAREPEKADQPEPSERSGPTDQQHRQAPSRRAKERVTIHVAPELIDQVRRASFWTPGLTVSDLAETALAGEIERMERKRGEAFPPIPDGKKVRTGRPVKARA